VINFWATWCASCTKELPDLRDLQAEVGSENLNVIAVNAGERSSAASKFIRWLKAPDFKIGMDPTLVIADAYGVRGMQQSVFIDSAGVIRAVYVGQLNKDQMMRYLSATTEGADATNKPGPLRILTTVAREHVLLVKPLGDGEVTFASKSL
jgi:thiol-disulfide isomerase/thioredoxin